MDNPQWKQVLEHKGFSITCFQCSAVALLGIKDYGTALAFEAEHRSSSGHEGTRLMRQSMLLSMVTGSPSEELLMKKYRLVKEEAFNTSGARK